MGNGAKIRYYVLFTQNLKQWEVTETIRKTLPEGRGTVFYPCAELWMGSLGQSVVEPLFPGYVFIRSDMDPYEMHDFIRERRREVLSFIKELRISERKTAGEVAAVEGDEDLADLNEDEAELLDFMLGFSMEGEAQEHGAEVSTAEKGGAVKAGMEVVKEKAARIEAEAVKAGMAAERAGEEAAEGEASGDVGNSGKRIWRRKLPAMGVLGMSYGYKEKNGRYVVMEGPLKGHEDRIVDVNVRDRRAYLDLKVGGRQARVGLTIHGKRCWFPEDKGASEVLGDGTVVNCRDIAAVMMRSMKDEKIF